MFKYLYQCERMKTEASANPGAIVLLIKSKSI